MIHHSETNPKLNSTKIQWFPGHMKKTKELISKYLKSVDVIMEVLDARLPLSSQNPLLQEIFANHPHKKKIIILNKADLAANSGIKQWIKKYTQRDTFVVSLNSLEDDVLKLIYSACVEHFRTHKWFGKRAIIGMIVGIPNVGKSTIINALIKKKKATIGNRPGITQTKQWLKINKNLEVIDTPGLLWHKFKDPLIGLKLSLLGIIKDEVVELEQILNYGINFMLQKYPAVLQDQYNIILVELLENKDEQNTDQLSYQVLVKIAQQKNFIKKKGESDIARAGRCFLKDLRNGKLGKIILDDLVLS